MYEVVLAKVSDFFINLISAVIILLIGIIIGRALGKVLIKFLNELELNKIIHSELKIATNLEGALGLFLTYFVYAVTLIIALNTLNITTPVFYTLLGAASVLALLSLVIGIRDFFPNFMAGLSLMRGKKFREGEQIELDKKRFRVMNIGFLETRIKTRDGDVLFIPNAEMARKKITNITRKRKSKK